MPDLFAYTDGACSGNPGPGGWGALLQAKTGGQIVKERELNGGEAETTNNRMELLAAIAALESLTRASDITIVTDSAYVKNGGHRLDSRLEAQRLEDLEQEAGQERGPVAKAGRGAGAAPGDVGMGQGPCGPPGKRTRR